MREVRGAGECGDEGRRGAGGVVMREGGAGGVMMNEERLRRGHWLQLTCPDNTSALEECSMRKRGVRASWREGGREVREGCCLNPLPSLTRSRSPWGRSSVNPRRKGHSCSPQQADLQHTRYRPYSSPRIYIPTSSPDFLVWVYV